MTDVAAPTKLEERRRVLELLRAVFPASIGSFKPLQIGIYHDLVKELPELRRKHLNAALSAHTRELNYQEALAAEGAERVDLHGVVVEPVEDEHRAHAAARVAEIQKNMKAKKKAA